MAITRCSSGHYYDDKKYLQCPYCGINLVYAESFVAETADEQMMLPKEEEADQTLLLTEGEQNQRLVLKDEDNDQTLLLTEEEADRTLLLSEEEADRTLLLMEDNPGISETNRKTGNVTGWLVCIEGMKRGCAYPLYEGRNPVGRSPEMDVCLEGDFRIASWNHCIIEYDGNTNRFMLIPNPGAETLINRKMVEKKKRIHSGDKIGMGDSVFEFVAFCHGRKRW